MHASRSDNRPSHDQPPLLDVEMHGHSFVFCFFDIDKKKKKELQCDVCVGSLRTYELPRKSWNLILPMVVSASKLGNSSPRRIPGMMVSSLLLRHERKNGQSDRPAE